VSDTLAVKHLEHAVKYEVSCGRSALKYEFFVDHRQGAQVKTISNYKKGG